MNQTKKAISDAFWQLLEERPYNKITVQNIVECCRVNRNTFYYHFQDIPALAEYSIKEWTEQIIKNNCEFGSPISCITPIVQEFIKRKTAFIHIYRSSHREEFMRYLNEISLHIVQLYIDSATKDMNILPEDKSTFIWYYKCTFAELYWTGLMQRRHMTFWNFVKKSVIFMKAPGKEPS